MTTRLCVSIITWHGTKECQKTHLEVILDILDIMREQRRGQHARRIVKYALRLAQLGVDVVQRFEEGLGVDDVNGIRLDLARGADGFLERLLLELQLLGPPCKEGHVLVALRCKQRRHSPPNARPGANDDDGLVVRCHGFGLGERMRKNGREVMVTR